LWRIISSWPFTLFGLLTLVLFLVAETFHQAGAEGGGIEALHAFVRVAIIPLWIMRYVVVAIGLPLFGAEGPFPSWYNILTIPTLLLPYIVADLLLVQAWRDAPLRRNRFY
jgi:hypothetical protein